MELINYIIEDAITYRCLTDNAPTIVLGKFTYEKFVKSFKEISVLDYNRLRLDEMRSMFFEKTNRYTFQICGFNVEIGDFDCGIHFK